MLSKYFKDTDFTVKDGSNLVYIDNRIPPMLDKLQDYFGKPIHINSAYRSPVYNKKIGGAKNSQHQYGKAVDVSIAGVPPSKVAEIARKLGFTGIGTYKSFTHIDLGAPRSWRG